MVAVAILGIAVACGRTLDLDLSEGDRDGGAAPATEGRDAADDAITPDADLADGDVGGTEPDGTWMCSENIPEPASGFKTRGECQEAQEKKRCGASTGEPCRVGEPERRHCTPCVDPQVAPTGYSFTAHRCQCEPVQ